MVFVSALLSAICLFLFLYPYLFYPLTLRLFAAKPTAPVTPTAPPTASLMFSAFNEGRSLPAKLDNLRAIRALAPTVELLAYDDASTDGSVALLAGGSDIGLRVIPAPVRTGKALGMRQLVAASSGEICIFTDANVIVEPASIGALLDCFADPQVGGVAGRLRYVNWKASTTARVGAVYWNLEERLKSLESRCGSIVSADGSIFAVRRALYPRVPEHLLDDMTVSVAVIASGARLMHTDAVLAYEKGATSSADEFQRKRRIACRAFNTHRYVWPMIRRHYGRLDRYKYVGHKLLRWFGLIPLVLAVLFAASALVLAGRPLLLAAIVGAAGAGGLLGRAGVPALAAAVEALRLNAATLCGIWDSLAGRTYQTWQPAPTRH